MPYFRRKPSEPIEAHQYLPDQPIPNGILFKGEQAYVITIQEIEVPVSFGEWIVAEKGGKHHYPIKDGLFQELYEHTNEE